MEDNKIIDLYWQRSDQAIPQTETKYGAYCRTIAYNICRNHEDTDECLNDTWLRAWNTMPDKRPHDLSAYLGRITQEKNYILLFSEDSGYLLAVYGNADMDVLTRIAENLEVRPLDETVKKCDFEDYNIYLDGGIG